MAPLLGSEEAGEGSIPTAAGPDSPGVTPPAVIPNLAQVYAAGAGNQLADDVMLMATGNYRFLGIAGIAGALPAAGFFESHTTAGDTRIGTDYFARSYPLGAHVGGVTFDQFDGYDPTWNGTFRGADGIQHIATQVGFSNGSSPQTGPTPGMVFGREVYWNIFGFGDGTDYWPLLDANDGAREDVRWDLYNETEGVAAERGRLTGWGTWIGKPRLEKHGTTFALDTQAQFHIPGGTLADDGVGWAIRNNTDDPPYGIVRWFWGLGSSGWEILGRNSGTGQPQSLLKMDPTNGAVFGVPVTFPSPVDGAVGSYVSDVLDFTTPADNLNLNIPKRPGYYFLLTRWSIIIYNFAGALTSGNLTLKWGNNATHDNINSQALTTGSLVNVPGNTAQYFSTNPAQISSPLIDSGTQIVGRISTVYTGPTTLSGRLLSYGSWVKTS